MTDNLLAEYLYNHIRTACQEYLPFADDDINQCTTRTLAVANALFNNALRITRNQSSLITSNNGTPISLKINLSFLDELSEIVTSSYSLTQKDNLVKSLIENITLSHKFFRKSYLKSDGTAVLMWEE